MYELLNNLVEADELEQKVMIAVKKDAISAMNIIDELGSFKCEQTLHNESPTCKTVVIRCDIPSEHAKQALAVRVTVIEADVPGKPNPQLVHIIRCHINKVSTSGERTFSLSDVQGTSETRPGRILPSFGDVRSNCTLDTLKDDLQKLIRYAKKH